VQLRFGPGAVTQPTPVQLARLTPQGLPGLLPYGWSPVDAIDILPAGQVLSTPAELEIPPVAGLASGRLMHLVRWDGGASAWRVVSSQPNGSAAIIAAIEQTGQYAWVVGDVTPTAPPLSADGELLLGGAPFALPADALANVAPQPRVLIYEPGARSQVSTEVPATQPLTS